MGNIDLELPLHICPIGYFSKYEETRSEREYVDSNNTPISIKLFRKHWYHLDWLSSIGEEVDMFIKKTHAAFKLKKDDECFDTAMMNALIKDFKARLEQHPDR